MRKRTSLPAWSFLGLVNRRAARNIGGFLHALPQKRVLVVGWPLSGGMPLGQLMVGYILLLRPFTYVSSKAALFVRGGGPRGRIVSSTRVEAASEASRGGL